MNVILFIIITIIFFILIIASILLTSPGYVRDRFKHPEEWKNKGSSGERILYNTLVNDYGIPDKQILRNVYIPTKGDKTTEIDLLVISKKGIFVFECKNYGGNIYGDAKRKEWIQYLGSKKSYFYNPLLQNKNHVKHLKDYLKIEVPITPLVTTISRGKWKIKNLGDNDYILGFNCHLKEIYDNMPESEPMKYHFNQIVDKLKPLSRPDEEIVLKHISQTEQNKF